MKARVTYAGHSMGAAETIKRNRQAKDAVELENTQTVFFLPTKGMDVDMDAWCIFFY
jgi:hypothetical protein